jgi:hypothetical protein
MARTPQQSLQPESLREVFRYVLPPELIRQLRDSSLQKAPDAEAADQA